MSKPVVPAINFVKAFDVIVRHLRGMKALFENRQHLKGIVGYKVCIFLSLESA